MNGRRLILTLICLLAAAPAVAGTVYRCDSGDGVRSYSSKRIAGSSCAVVSSYRTQAYQPPPASERTPSAPVGGVTTAGATSAGSIAGASPAAGNAPKRPRFLRMGASTTFSYIDARGVRNFSNRRPAGIANVTVTRVEYPIFEMETCYACGAAPQVNFASIRLNKDAYRDEIAAASRDYGVEEAVVRAIIHAESAFRPNALSRVGAQGLMQLMPATARRFGVGNAFDAGQNIRGGVQYLAFLLKRFNGDLALAAAGYNAGEGAVDRYRGVPPYSETRRYVQRVGLLAERYRGSGFATR
jgi:soluble lytic murein transglycosylase-like protein